MLLIAPSLVTDDAAGQLLLRGVRAPALAAGWAASGDAAAAWKTTGNASANMALRKLKRLSRAWTNGVDDGDSSLARHVEVGGQDDGWRKR